MKKTILSVLLSIAATTCFAQGNTSTIESVHTITISRMDSDKYEIFAMTNTQDSIFTETNAFSFVTKGTYTTDDIKTFYLYRNVIHSIEGATLVGTVVATPAGKQTIHYGSLLMPANTTIYYMLYAKTTDSAIEGHTIFVAPIANVTDTPFTFISTIPRLAEGKALGFRPMQFSVGGELNFAPGDIFDGCRLGISGGFTTIYGDLEKSNAKAALMLDFSKQTNIGIVLDLEYQHAAVSSSTPANSWTTGLNETNHFNSVNINGKLYLAHYIAHPRNAVAKVLSRFYAGAGIGVIDNSLSDITNKFKETDVKTLALDMKTSSVAAVLPVNIGLNVDLKKLIDFHEAQLHVNYQMTYAFSDYVDGYSFTPAKARNNYNDLYSILSVGVSFYLGKYDRGE